MDLVVTKENSQGLALEGDINFSSTPEIYKQGCLYLDKTSLESVCFDFKGIDHSDISGLALMMGWLRKANALKKSIIFKDVPDGLQHIAQVCEVIAFLPLEGVGKGAG